MFEKLNLRTNKYHELISFPHTFVQYPLNPPLNDLARLTEDISMALQNFINKQQSRRYKIDVFNKPPFCSGFQRENIALLKINSRTIKSSFGRKTKENF